MTAVAVKKHLAGERNLSAGHWSYLKIDGRRVDDDRIEKGLR